MNYVLIITNFVTSLIKIIANAVEPKTGAIQDGEIDGLKERLSASDEELRERIRKAMRGEN
jgi:hypothetical protein